MPGFFRVGKDVIKYRSNRKKYKATLDPEIYWRLFNFCPQRSMGTVAPVKPLGLHSLGKPRAQCWAAEAVMLLEKKSSGPAQVCPAF